MFEEQVTKLGIMQTMSRVQMTTVTKGSRVNMLVLAGIRPSLVDLLVKIEHKVIETITQCKRGCTIAIPFRKTIIRSSLFEHV